VVTGRLASSDPNLQNIPVRTEEGRRIRTAFIAPPGHSIVSADYSQIELRIMAHLSATSACSRPFAHGEDVHRATAGEIFGVTPLEVGSDQRRVAKTINFGLIYGMSAFGLARKLDSSAAPRRATSTATSRVIRACPLHGRDACAGARAGLRRDRVRPPPVAAGNPFQQGGAPPGRRARRDQRAHAGHGRRPDQAGDDRRPELDRSQTIEVTPGVAGP
jgi:hypothetical protein